MFANDEMDIDSTSPGESSGGPFVGQTDQARVPIVVFTMRGDAVRTVTAYEASVRMRTGYFATKGRQRCRAKQIE